MAFDPDKALAPGIRIIKNAIIVPNGPGKAPGIARPAGVYDADGNYVPEGQCFRASDLPTTVEPDILPEVTDGNYRGGLWLYGGLLYQHFGHFLLESTARLWAAEQVDDWVKGELFLLKGDIAHAQRPIRLMGDLLTLFGAHGKRRKGVIEPTRVERLLVAPQGFGTGDMIGGCPEYRSFTKRILGEGIAAKGAEKIYISRTRLFSKRGRYFGEDRMEKLFEAEGYRIYHPQNEKIEDQIAQYKAARMIVSSDSSALHLAAFFAEPEDKIAIVLRRPGSTIEDYLTQYRAFAGVEPDVLDTLVGENYQLEAEKRKQMNEIYSVLDFPELGRQLAEAGYIGNASAWTALSAREIEAERKDIATRLEQDIRLIA
ncbi:MAG: glycosyltransferase 61 family protein [Maritimibacter sp.]